MSASAPWSVKGIDAKAREVAKDLARRSGMTLGEWLNQMILEGEDVGAMISRERERTEASAPASAVRTEGRRAPAYRETQNDLPEQPRRPAPFSSAARPLAARGESVDPRAAELRTSELRRRSIFEDRPRYDEDEDYGATSGELGRVARALESLSSRIEGSETRSATAVRGVSSAVDTILSRLERSEAAQAETHGRFAETAEDLRTTVERQEESREELAGRLEQAERLIDAQAERLEGLSSNLREEREHISRLETQLKSPAVQETVRAVEGALGKLANQLYEGEQRSRDTVVGIREDMVGLSHRLAQIEVRDPAQAAQAAIDKVVTRLAQRLEQAEAQTSGAIRALEQAFTTLDARLGRAEEKGDVTDPEQVASLSRLANDLSRRVEESRFELLNALDTRSHETVEQLRGLVDARTQGTTEHLLKVVGDRVAMAEKRSAAAIEKLGEDVMRVAETLNRRVNTVETAQHDGLARLGNEVNRVAEAFDSRYARGESSHAQALERLGGEIARISERLSVRLSETERRTAQAVEGVGRVIEEHRDHSRSELSDRIRQSEDRTAKMLEEARNRLDQKLAQVQTQSLLSEATARPARAQATDLPSPFGGVEPAAERTPFAAMPGAFDAQDDIAPVAIEPQPVAPEPVAPKTPTYVAPQPAPEPVQVRAPEPEAHAAETPADVFAPKFDPFAEDDLEYDLVPAEAHHDEPHHSDVHADSDPFAEVSVARKTAPRAAAFNRGRTAVELEDDIDDSVDAHAYAQSYSQGHAPRPHQDIDADMELIDDGHGVSVSTRDALAAARAAVRASMEGGYEEARSGLGLNLKSGASRSRGMTSKAKPAKESTVMRAFKASAIAAAVVGVGGMGAIALYRSAGQAPAPQAGTAAGNLAATAVVTPDRPDQGLMRAEFLSASQSLDARAPGAVDKLVHVAEQGYPQAQHKLSGIYRGEGNFVKPDDQAARIWTQRAAEGGVAEAMYNLGTMYYNGIGGPQNKVTAAMWFRKAAQYGIPDSQYNLGLLFERGEGMPINPSDAYKWLSIAAKSGNKDVATDAAREAAAIRQDLSDVQRQKADEAIAAFQPLNDGMGETSAQARN